MAEIVAYFAAAEVVTLGIFALLAFPLAVFDLYFDLV